ncbi:sulfatase-like hydrolase/transferase [Verrucomicrobiaceae bacterium N1E253]|uniref:Sulfatase-like hydrolase/transferase n=1 Tax=Oceaniferula marina TaxID=2748318 RepID=A0A851GJY7_9BACT|nr:sulfatase-like hydrolase/transferase [Oceaniferula marina]NWK57332.1 sulfatase-like hydrolase/transferase [Oceaniferula marina]
MKTIAYSVLTGVMALSAVCAKQDRPNILFIMTDDQAAWTTGYSGNKQAMTPALDSFREEAASLPNTFVNSPVCSPSRATLMTSRYPSEVKIMEYSHNPLSPEFETWPRLLQKNGYHTGLIGKWHLGGGESHPTKLGYDYFMGLLGGGCSPVNPPLEVDGKKIKVKGFMLDILTEDAMKFIENRPKDKPFMLSLHYRAPHGAYLPVRDEIWDKVKDKAYALPDFPKLKPNLEKMMRGYLASVSHYDWNFGRLMKKLDELGLRENTVVIVTSDHGYNIGHHGATHKGNGDWGSELPRSYHHKNLDKLPGKKMPNMWDTSLSPPHLIRWPETVKPNSTIRQEINFIDFFPTLCAMAGTQIPQGTVVRGKSFLPLLDGSQGDEEWNNPLLIQHDTHLTYVLRGYRTKKWKIVTSYSHNYGFLYDLEKDPGETKNLYENPEYKQVRERLTKEMESKMKAVGDPLFLPGEYPFTKKRKKK